MGKKEKKPEKIILEHYLVPEHIICSEEEKREVIEKYAGGNPYNLPYILAKDPVVQAIGAKPGDVIKIIRKSPTGHKTVYYRLVVKR
ncbi:DNA-directed RNA polymerase subunit H [Candidatus Geothermarchaeota archaeon ex4572_27]|nr:MAG: DNA-directed RNA polymerase subunit H [Candidatus Geothermarchaeota archaeon ex4572_27]